MRFEGVLVYDSCGPSVRGSCLEPSGFLLQRHAGPRACFALKRLGDLDLDQDKQNRHGPSLGSRLQAKSKGVQTQSCLRDPTIRRTD